MSRHEPPPERTDSQPCDGPQERTPAIEFVECCVHLRIRSMFFVPEEMRAGPGRIRVSTLGGYWCNRTSVASGPDDACVGPELCRPPRGCHEPAAD
ncbi:MAG: hypothetical protein IPM64_05600 [Phycisphaerales bacterium]|nr:hypothetical protein [Phycisphaerales bacterium]